MNHKRPTAYRPFVSVVIPTFNRGKSIINCLKNVLEQTYPNFEVIVCDDNSSDNTIEKVLSIENDRLTLIRNTKNGGPAISRNNAVHSAKGEIIFFTDDDVLVPRDWIEFGIKSFSRKDVLGVEGKIVYVSEDYFPKYSDRIVKNNTGGLYMTANIAYKKQAILDAGLFDVDMRQYEDRCLAYKIIEKGNIVFSKDFTVVHQREKYTFKTFFQEAAKVKYRVLALDKIDDETYFNGHFYEPLKYIVILFPPLLLARLKTHKFSSILDWMLLSLAYPRLFYERIILWRAAFNAKRFIL
jgi:glycosyltransferase involved in cell wall biosynthesis